MLRPTISTTRTSELAWDLVGKLLSHCLTRERDTSTFNPSRILMLNHENGVRVSDALAKVYRNQRAHDPGDLNRARELASDTDCIPVGILYRNPEVPCYEDLRASTRLRTTEYVRAGLEAEFDKFTIRPQ